MGSLANLWLGRLDEAARLAERAREVRRDSQNPEEVWIAVMALSFISSIAGDSETGYSHARRGFEMASQHLSPLFVGFSFAWLGVARAGRSEWTEAIAALEHAVELFRQMNAREPLLEIMPFLADAYLGANRAGDARVVAEEAVASTRRCRCVLWEAHAQIMLARAMMRPECGGTRAEIEAALETAAQCIRLCGARAMEPWLREARGEWARFEGDDSARQRELREAHRLYTEMGATGHAERLAQELREVAAGARPHH